MRRQSQSGLWAVSVISFTFTVPGMWSPSILRRHKWSAVGLSVRTSLLFFLPSFICRMAMGTKNAATLIGELRLVAPPRLELSQTEPKSGVLPLHHGANLFARCMVANQSRAITPWGNRFFCVFAGAKIRDYSDISKFFGKNLSHLHAVCVEMLCVLLKIAWLTMCFDDVDDIVANLLATIDDVHIHHT